jgi:predicted nucleic acid-binding protein
MILCDVNVLVYAHRRSEWITTDRDYARFPGLRWRHPLDGS